MIDQAAFDRIFNQPAPAKGDGQNKQGDK